MMENYAVIVYNRESCCLLSDKCDLDIFSVRDGLHGTFLDFQSGLSSTL